VFGARCRAVYYSTHFNERDNVTIVIAAVSEGLPGISLTIQEFVAENCIVVPFFERPLS
jgi:hypothetical protein